MRPDESIWSLLEERVAITPEALFALDERGQRLTFADLHDGAVAVAAGLAEHGVCRGSVVSWQLPNWTEAAVLTLALCRLEAVQNPLVPILRRREVEFICRQAHTEVLVVPDRWRNFDYANMATAIAQDVGAIEVLVADRSLPSADPGTLHPKELPAGAAWYFYSSGTTGDAKGAIHSDASLIAAARGFYTSIELSRSDRVPMVMPVTHVGGIIHIIAALETGSSEIFCEQFDPERSPLFLREQAATVMPGSVPFVQAYLACAERHPELEPLFPAARIMTAGGSPKPPHLYYEVKERFGVGTVSGYGMTECPMAVWGSPTDPDEALALSEGRPVPTIDLRIVKPDGGLAVTGEEGEVWLKGAQLMSGYVDQTLEKDSFDEDGYFRSGDLGRLDREGYVTITGRLKDIIIRNMENISATEVEHLLFTHPKVIEVAVIGVPDPKTGERVCAVIVPADRADPPTLRDLGEHLLAAGLSRQKVPEQIELVDRLPRNGMEKVLKSELSRQVLGVRPLVRPERSGDKSVVVRTVEERA
jgi:acyl-CoA synthetase (AMP-forming)/AMP-acid ligase II